MKLPKRPLGSPLVQRTLTAATLGVAACAGSSGPPPQVPPQVTPPMVEEGEHYEDVEADQSDGYATPPADASTKMPESPPPMVPPRNTNPPPMVPPQETRKTPPQVAPDESKRVRDPQHRMAPQVAPPQEPNDKHSKEMPSLGPTPK